MNLLRNMGSTLNECDICIAIRRQPNLGLRYLIATTAAIISVGGPAGPVFLLVFPEKSKRYFFLLAPYVALTVSMVLLIWLI